MGDITKRWARLLDEASRYLTECESRPTPAYVPRPPAELVNRALEWLAKPPSSENLPELARELFETANRLHSKRYMGHQVPPPAAEPAIFEFLGALTNNAMGVYEMGPFPTAAERALVTRLAEYAYPGAGSAGIGTHGGSLANLTAILAARNFHFKESWARGLESRRPALITSADSHYSVARAAGIAGIGADQVIKARLDSRRRIDPAGLPDALAEARARGLVPFCLVGSSCTTSTGSFDPLDELADFSEKNRLWLHVDGAHGAPLLLSRKHRGLLAGVERSDSLTWDAHKMMGVPALCTFLFYRDRAMSYLPFRQDAPYLLDPSSQDALLYDGAVRTIECTKRGLALTLFALWCSEGPTYFERLIDGHIARTRELYEKILASDDFEAVHEPECNIFCFRHVPKDLPEDRVSAFQTQLRKKLLNSGEFYITATVLDGKTCLRVTLIHPSIGTAELDGLLSTLRTLGKSTT